MRIVESLAMTDRIEDWSRVRSPSRAERRRRQGHRQNIAVHEVPKKEGISIDGGRAVLVHPEVARELRRQLPPVPASYNSILGDFSR